MANTFHVAVQVPDRSYHALAKVELKERAVAAGFTGHRLGEVEIIISEIVTNLTKHTSHGGTVLCRVMEKPDPVGLELIAIDNGPGMSSPKKMMQDGRSTTQTLGHGLGAIQRLSDEFDLYSVKGWGTILLSRIYAGKKRPVKSKEEIMMTTLRVAKHGETACGDNCGFFVNNRQHKIAVIDGLGHGENASEAAQKAVDSMGEHLASLPNELLRNIHRDIKKTRGAVMAVAYIDATNKQLAYCGVGNITGKLINRLVSLSSRTLSSYNGIVGHTLPGTINNMIVPWDNKYDILVLHSDGLSSRWDIARYADTLKHHSMIFCAALYKDLNRGNDDSTVSIIRYEKNLQ